jgi:hypothetical protein
MDTKTENWKETVVTPSTLKSCLRFARESGIWCAGFTTQQNEVLDTIANYSDLADLRLEAVADIYMEHAEGDFDQNKEQIERLMSIIVASVVSAAEVIQFPTMYLGDQVPEGHIEISGSHVGPGCLIYTDCSNTIVQDTHAWIPWGNLTPEYQASKDIKAQRCCRAKDAMLPADVRAVGTTAVFDFSIYVPESFLHAESCPENTERFTNYVEQQCHLSDARRWNVFVRTPCMDRFYIVKLQDGTKFLLAHTK